ncbi:MAG: sulfotransferase family protein, partial [Longimicrobiales bacterium]
WVLREDLFRLNEGDPGPDAVRLQREWLMRLDRNRRVFLEKSPPNAARTRWLQAHFQDAHFIAIVRNGYAVAEGIRRKAEPRHLRHGWPLDLCARQWARSCEVLLEDAAHLRRVLWVRYENLAERPAEEFGRILTFLGLDGSIDLERSWNVHEQNSEIRNMNDASIERLTADERSIVTREAESMLRHFGYEVLV